MNVIYYELQDYGDDFLMHHGIKGMKWGIRRTAEQLGHKVKGAAGKAKRKAETFHNERIASGKAKAIATGDYNKIKKYQQYMTDEELRKAQGRMEQNNRLRDIHRNDAPSRLTQWRIDRAVRKGNFKALSRLEKKMSDADYKAAYDRLDTRRKLKAMNDQSKIERGIKALETIGRVGSATLTIGQTAYGFAKLEDQKEELKENRARRAENEKQRKENEAVRREHAMQRREAKERQDNPFRSEMKKNIIERANKVAEDVYASTPGSVSEKTKASAEAYARYVESGADAVERMKRRHGWSDGGGKKK